MGKGTGYKEWHGVVCCVYKFLVFFSFVKMGIFLFFFTNDCYKAFYASLHSPAQRGRNLNFKIGAVTKFKGPWCVIIDLLSSQTWDCRISNADRGPSWCRISGINNLVLLICSMPTCLN